MTGEREVFGKPFPKGHRNTHDCAAAGREGKANSPWRHGCWWLSGGGTRKERVDRALALARNRRNSGANTKPRAAADSRSLTSVKRLPAPLSGGSVS